MRFNQMSKFDKICLILLVIFAIIAITSVLVCALCPNLIVKIVSGVFIGLSGLIIAFIGILFY